MSLTLPKTWTAGEVLTAADLNTQFDSIEAKFSGAILGTEITAGTIPNAQLINQYSEFLVNLVVTPTTAVVPPNSTTVPLAFMGLPGSTTDGIAYTVLSATGVVKDTGGVGSTVKYKVEWGGFTGAGGAWTAVSTTIAEQTVTSTSAEGILAAVPALTTTALTLSNANPRFLALFITAAPGATALDTAYCSVTVTLKLKRTSGLRA